ncbi:MAG: hypothetical protein Q7O12_15530 [Deltaproteobacteria bacterium]|nr:hypothetical protein [Deltaproteobacteria bacterium]
MVNQKHLAEIGLKMAQQVAKIGEAYMVFTEKRVLPPDLRELFLSVASLANEGAEELERDLLPAGADTRH